jgi:hypothetical protein
VFRVGLLVDGCHAERRRAVPGKGGLRKRQGRGILAASLDPTPDELTSFPTPGRCAQSRRDKRPRIHRRRKRVRRSPRAIFSTFSAGVSAGVKGSPARRA